MEATRGVVFVLKAKTDGSVGEEFNKLSQRATALQAMLSDVRLGGIDLTAFETGIEKAAREWDAFKAKTQGAPAANVKSSTTATRILAVAPPTPVEHADVSTAAEIDAAKSVTAALAAETDKQAALPDKVVRARIKMLARIQQADHTAREQETAAAEKAAALAQGEAEKEIARNAKVQLAHQTALEKEQAADKNYWEAFGVFGEKSQAKRQAAEAKAAADANELQQARKTALEKEQENDKNYCDAFVSYGEKSLSKREKEEERATKETAKQATARERELEREAERIEQLHGKMWSLARDIRGSLVDATDAAMTTARGFVEMGFIGEENLNEVIDKLLGIQSAMDTVIGGMRVWQYLSQGAQFYVDRLLAVKKAEEAVAAVRLAGDVAGVAKSAGSGVAGAVGAGVIGGEAGSVGAGAIGAAVAPVAAAVAAFVGAAAGITAIVQTAQQAAKHGIGGGADHNSAVDKIATWEVSLAEWTHAIDTGTRKTKELADAMENERSARAELDKRVTAAYERENQAGAQRLGGQMRLDETASGLSSYATPQDHVEATRRQLEADRTAIEMEIERVNRQLAASSGPQGQVGPGQEEALRAKGVLEQHVLDLKQRELAAALEERRLSIDGAKERLQLMAAQLSNLKQQTTEAKAAADAAQGKVESAMEAFAHLNDGEKAMVLHIRQAVDEGRVGDLTEDQKKLGERAGDERTREEIRRHRVGEAQDFIQRAREGHAFGAEEKQEAVNARGMAAKAKEREGVAGVQLQGAMHQEEVRNKGTQFKLGVDNQISVKVTMDSDLEQKTKAAVLNAMKASLEDQDTKMRRWIDEAMAQMRRERDRQRQTAGQRRTNT